MTKLKTIWLWLVWFLKYFVLIALIILVLLVLFLFVGKSSYQSDIKWGVNFSAKHTSNLGLDPRSVYTALLDDLGVKRIKIAFHWDQLEPSQFIYDFAESDWQIGEAEKRGIQVVPAIGMKTPRWPECHIPSWSKTFDRGSLQHQIRKYLEAFVNRYKNSPAVVAWQIENEPLFVFGDCPWYDEDFLKSEITLVKNLDSSRPILITDTGEFSAWFWAAQMGDEVGSTLYRKVWFKQLERYWTYPFPATFYNRRAWLVKKIFGKEVIDAELQAEPWGPVLYYDLTVPEQMQSMDFDQFQKNIDFARKTTFKEHYFWGAEWWYWMKEKQGDSRYWDYAKKLFRGEIQ